MGADLDPLSGKGPRQSGRGSSQIRSHHLDGQSGCHSQINFEKLGDESPDATSKDLEAAEPSPQSPPIEREKTHDPNLVTFGGPEDMENPKNWSFKRKWGATVIVSIFTFIS